MATAKSTKDATQAFETIAADTQKAAKDQMEKLSSGFEKLSELSQDNMDAVMKSSEIAAKALEGFGTEVSAYSKKSFEDGVAAAQDFASAKNATELFEKQAAFAKASFEALFAQSTKFNDMFAASAKDVTKPLNDRMTAAADAMESFTA